MKTNAKISQDCAPTAKKKSEQAKTSEMTTTIVSWGSPIDDCYHFPPGLFGVKSISCGSLGCIVLKNDGTLTGWHPGATGGPYGFGPGGQSSFHRHLETLEDVVRIKASFVESQKRLGAFIWKADGHCEYICIRLFDSYSPAFNNQKVEVLPLGQAVVDVILGAESSPADIAVMKDGTAIPIAVDEKEYQEVVSNSYMGEEYKALIHKINKDPNSRLNDFKRGYLVSDSEIVWLDQDGDIHLVDTQYSGHKFPSGLKGVTDLVGASGEYIILKDGKLQAFDLNNGMKPLPDYGAYGSIKGPFVGIRYLGPQDQKYGALAISESGKAILVTTNDKVKVKDRDPYSKKSITPEEWRIIDAASWPGGSLGVAMCPTATENEFQTSQAAGHIDRPSGNLAVWGQDDDSWGRCPISITQIPPDLGPVVDAQLFSESWYKGWICVKEDGSVCGLVSRESLDLMPSWFPKDICQISVEGGCFVATRRDGRVFKWGPGRLEPGKPITAEELNKHPVLRPEFNANMAIKLTALHDVALGVVRETSAFKGFIDMYSGSGVAINKDQLFYSVTRGQALLDQAVGWWKVGPGEFSDPPCVGKPGPTAPLRGLQWRLCIAWAGFETWLGGLLATENARMDAGSLARWSKGLPKFEAIAAPKAGKGVSRWMEEEGGDAVLDFLGVNKTDRETLKQWLLKGEAILEWTDMALLAKALRNATVHGALSATATQELGLRDVLEKLPTLLQEFAHGALRLYTGNNK